MISASFNSDGGHFWISHRYGRTSSLVYVSRSFQGAGGLLVANTRQPTSAFTWSEARDKVNGVWVDQMPERPTYLAFFEAPNTIRVK